VNLIIIKSNIMGKKVFPVGKKILIKQHKPKETFGSSNIYVPDSHKTFECIGTVVSIGKEVEEISEGDDIQYTDYCVPVEMQHSGESHLIINQGDVLVIIKDV